MRFRRTLRICALGGLIGSLSLPVMAQEEPAKTDSPEVLFEQLDKDKDGKLTKEEVGEDRERFFKRLVRVGDKNEDGTLTKEEFIAANRPEERPAQPQPGNPGGQRPQFGGTSAEFFKRIDGNGDGKLSEAEIPEPLKERFQPAFDRLGKDELTLEDLQKIAPNQFPPDRNRMGEEFFKRADTNGDGKLTVDEAPEQLKRTVQSLLQRAGKGEDGAITLEEFKRVGFGGMPRDAFGGGFGGMTLRTLDADRDGKLSKEELSKAVEQFDKLDRNSDGSLDARELSGFAGFGDRPNPGAPNPNRNQPPNIDQFVNGMLERYDADKDGKLSRKELSDVPDRAKERFGEWDADKDGIVTKEEMTLAMKRSFGRTPEGSDRQRPSRPQSDN